MGSRSYRLPSTRRRRRQYSVFLMNAARRRGGKDSRVVAGVDSWEYGHALLWLA